MTSKLTKPKLLLKRFSILRNVDSIILPSLFHPKQLLLLKFLCFLKPMVSKIGYNLVTLENLTATALKTFFLAIFHCSIEKISTKP